jgi:uncharacterized DUF497 family protein
MKGVDASTMLTAPLHASSDKGLRAVSKGRLLVVAHAEDGDEIRIISARQASRRERAMYEEDHEAL